jgi:precorrin-6B methylase 2
MRRTLAELGWFKSNRTGKPVAQDGTPIPWWTYPAISFLSERVASGLSVFEFGSGHSTLWWAGRVKYVVSAELNEGWFNYVRELVPANVALRMTTFDGLADAIEQEGMFDLIVVDGGNRVRCAERALQHLAPEGVIIWDDSDWQLFQDALPMFTKMGFRELAFHGLKPIMGVPSRTSILYRRANCLGI